MVLTEVVFDGGKMNLLLSEIRHAREISMLHNFHFTSKTNEAEEKVRRSRYSRFT